MTQIISFKSIPEYYRKEAFDIKRNTVRLTTDWDYDRWKEFVEAKTIKIINSLDPLEFFYKEITDKTVYQGIVIISW